MDRCWSWLACLWHGCIFHTSSSFGALATITSTFAAILIFKSQDRSLNAMRIEQRPALIAFLITLAGLGFGLLFASFTGLSIALSLFGIIQFLPQLSRSFNDLRLKRVAGGSSVLSSGLRALYTLSWAFYAGAWFFWGFSIDKIDWPLVTWGIAGAIAFSMQAFISHSYSKSQKEQKTAYNRLRFEN